MEKKELKNEVRNETRSDPQRLLTKQATAVEPRTIDPYSTLSDRCLGKKFSPIKHWIPCSLLALSLGLGLPACSDDQETDGMTGGTGGEGTGGTESGGIGGTQAGGTGGGDTGGGGGTGGTGTGGDATGGLGGDAGASGMLTFEEQVAEGSMLYAENCADCHGDSGQGTSQAPPLVGADALPLEPPANRNVREADFVTAAEVFAFASENMPAGDPSSVSDEDKVLILAFALSANGVELDMPLTPANAGDIIINEQ